MHDTTAIEAKVAEAIQPYVKGRSSNLLKDAIRRPLAISDFTPDATPTADTPKVETPSWPTDVAEDTINPSHYRKHPSGIECIEVVRHMNFNIGNAIKYIWRYQDKGDPIENLKKAQWYLNDEILRLTSKL